jgi:hypothetical protein
MTNVVEELPNPRDRFARQAIHGLLARQGTTVKPAILARMAYDIADAMLQARGPGASAVPVLRDLFAEQAMNGLVANQGAAVKPAIVARMSYEIADSLLEVRGTS